jgi:DNA primase
MTLASQINEFVSNTLQLHSETATEYVCYCPFHTNTDSPAFYVNKLTALWYCHNPACGQKGNWLTLQQRLGTGSIHIAREEISEEALGNLLNAEEETAPEETWDEALERVSINYESDESERVSYLVDRGFSLPILRHFEIGFSERQQRVVIPIRDEGFRLVGFIGRAIDEERKPKYLYSDGLKKAHTLFNIAHAKSYKEVIITEGSLDAIKVHQAGFPNVVSSLGANVSISQIETLEKYFQSIIILSDNDQPGDAMQCGIINRLPRMDLWVTENPEGIKDPGEMNEQQIRDTIMNKQNYFDYLFDERMKKFNTI